MDNLFKLANCEKLGNYIVAERDLEVGQIILTEQPLLSFPAKLLKPGVPAHPCVGCFRVIPHDFMTCSECHFPICNIHCSKELFHTELECKLMAEKGILPSNFVYGFLKYVRIFASMNRFPERYQKFQLFASEIGPALDKYSTAINEECNTIWRFLTVICQMPVTLADVKKVYGALKINCFRIEWNDASGYTFRGNAIYEIGCQFSHGCFPNLEWLFVKGVAENGAPYYVLRLHCTRAIKKGETLSMAYTTDGLNYGTGFRIHAQQKYFPFDCLCPRCEDATECGTYMSAHKCPICKNGDILPENPRSSFTSLWKCSKCPLAVPGTEILNEIEELQTKIKPYTNGDFTDSRKEGLDAFIREHSGKTLHPNHFLIVHATLYWLIKSDFTEELMVESKKSTKLFQKILNRFNKCLGLAQKFVPTSAIAQMDLSLVDVIAAYAFKSTSYGDINDVIKHPRWKYRYSRLLLKHLRRGHFWMQRQVNYHFDYAQETFDDHCNIWQYRCNSYHMELSIYHWKDYPRPKLWPILEEDNLEED